MNLEEMKELMSKAKTEEKVNELLKEHEEMKWQFLKEMLGIDALNALLVEIELEDIDVYIKDGQVKIDM